MPMQRVFGVGAIVASFVSTECPVGRGMWGVFGKPLKHGGAVPSLLDATPPPQ